MIKWCLTILFLLLPSAILIAQNCSGDGRTPTTATLVCGNQSVIQPVVSVCGHIPLLTPCGNGGLYQNINPYWYKIACYSPGTLGFTIFPDEPDDNYDWVLFDITGRNPDDVFTIPSILIAANWSQDPGETGASNLGVSAIECSAVGAPLFSTMPTLTVGHEYVILVSHNTPSTTGFQLSFSGGTAGITDPLLPKLTNARLSCDGTQIIVKMNQGMSCASLAADGSDFTVSGGYSIIGASSTGCSFRGTTDSVVLAVNTPLPSGTYTLSMQNGNDGNTLQDICNRDIPVGQQINFVVAPLQPTPLDSIQAPGCAPIKLNLVFSRPIRCTSIASDASDFTISGPQSVSITGVTSACSVNGTTAASIITLQLSAALLIGGNYQINLVRGTDGNTIIDECGRETSPSSRLVLIKEKVSGIFTYSINASCKNDTLLFSHDGNHNVDHWTWSFDNTTSSSLQNPDYLVFPATGTHTAKLIVSNGACSDTTTQTILLNNEVSAGFDLPSSICPEDAVTFTNITKGGADTWQWYLGNVLSSSIKDPLPVQLPPTGTEIIYLVKLVAGNSLLNCKDSVTHSLKVLSSCYIAVPTAFTPNGDGLNDYLYPVNALKADNLQFRVYNRVGQLVFQTKDWTQKWDGRIKGILQNTGVYAWVLSFIHHDTHQKVFMKGTTVLIR